VGRNVSDLDVLLEMAGLLKEGSTYGALNPGIFLVEGIPCVSNRSLRDRSGTQRFSVALLSVAH